MPNDHYTTQTRKGFEDWATERRRQGLPYTQVDTRVDDQGRVRSTTGNLTFNDFLPLLIAGGGVGLGALAGGGAGLASTPATTGGITAGSVGTTIPLSATAAGAGAAGAAGASTMGGLGGLKAVAPYILGGLSLLGGRGNKNLQQMQERQMASAEQLQQMQMNRLQQSNPLYEAILRMAMGLLPTSARGGAQPTQPTAVPRNRGF